MAEDREILKEIWSGQIPVQFSLSSIEVVTMQQPEPYYAMVSRVTYFPLVMDKVLKYFSRFVTELKHNCQDLWLEFEGQPLKWNYPIGLLYDLLSKDIKLPWTLTVHFEDFPEEEIIRLNSRPLIESNFMSTIKEADYIKHRSQVINAMQKKEHNQLWLGLLNDKFDQFWLVNRKLMEPLNGEHFKHIPIRFYHHDDSTSFVQMLVKPTTDAGQPTLFRHAILTFLPSLNSEGLSEGKCGFRFITHGIEPPLDTPIQWLSEHLSYPDNFLHISILELV